MCARQDDSADHGAANSVAHTSGPCTEASSNRTDGLTGATDARRLGTGTRRGPCGSPSRTKKSPAPPQAPPRSRRSKIATRAPQPTRAQARPKPHRSCGQRAFVAGFGPGSTAHRLPRRHTLDTARIAFSASRPRHHHGVPPKCVDTCFPALLEFVVSTRTLRVLLSAIPEVVCPSTTMSAPTITASS